MTQLHNFLLILFDNPKPPFKVRSFAWLVIFNQVNTNVFRIGPDIESKKLPVHGSLVGLVVEPVMS